MVLASRLVIVHAIEGGGKKQVDAQEKAAHAPSTASQGNSVFLTRHAPNRKHSRCFTVQERLSLLRLAMDRIGEESEGKAAMTLDKIVNGFAAMAVLLAALPLAPALAETPRNVSDLVGARAPGGEEALERRGYTHIESDSGDDRSWSYWWNGSQKQCISIVVMNGRFDSITSTPAPDCNQKNGKSNTGAIVAGAAAVAIIGALALSHKSHNHSDGRHYDNDRQEADYERGYRDGLYNQSYHNYDRSEPYSRGYEAGGEQRNHETSYRGQHHPGQSGYRPSVGVADLVGARASSADGDMRNRGFSNVDGVKSGNTSYSIWYNRQTRQCMQMGVADGQVVNMTNIHSSPRCQ